jgi:hypothetical protein
MINEGIWGVGGEHAAGGGSERRCSISGSRTRRISKWIFHLDHRLEAIFDVLQSILGLGHRIE